MKHEDQKHDTLREARGKRDVATQHLNGRATPAGSDKLSTPANDNHPNSMSLRAWRDQLSQEFDVTAFTRVETGRALLAIGSSWTVIIGAAAGATSAFAFLGPLAGGLAYAATLLLIARSQRVLELYVHEGSHFLIARGGGAQTHFNDIACNALCAWPTLQDVASYRRQHIIHHARYGREDDPCRNRPELDLVRRAGRKNLFEGLKRLARFMPTYVSGYYREMGANSRTLAKGLAWHGVALSALTAAVGPAAIGIWVAFWALPFIVVLPWIRAIAEAEEHDYSAGAEHQGTYNNLGPVQRWLIHPAGDAYHILHHGWANVPTHKFRALHEALTKRSQLYRNTLTRRRVLQ